MEQWVRNLSKKNALTIGSGSLLIGMIIWGVIYIGLEGSLLSTIIVSALLGGIVGFSHGLIYKGVTGFTPQERRELSEE